jgi:hypothetical protein
MHWV